MLLVSGPAPVAAGAGVAIAAQSGAAGQVALNPEHPQRYVVKRGDTLWDISAMFLRNPWYWPEIWYVNPQIANPHLIYPGD
ncbi:MAG TPA: LysM peptidoglycan-binding domain-containing protein, partial [Chromatiales bacterium]|nr:LysM peptidoglycan-binding domain-containing protein [Chromatiales bacterium]